MERISAALRRVEEEEQRAEEERERKVREKMRKKEDAMEELGFFGGTGEEEVVGMARLLRARMTGILPFGRERETVLIRICKKILL